MSCLPRLISFLFKCKGETHIFRRRVLLGAIKSAVILRIFFCNLSRKFFCLAAWQVARKVTLSSEESHLLVECNIPQSKHFSQHLHCSILRAAFSTTFKTLRGKIISGSVTPEFETGVRALWRSNSSERKPLGGGGTPYNGLYGEAPPVRVTFFKHSVISLGKRSKKDAFYGCEKAQKTFWFCDLFIFYRQCVYSS